MATTALLVVDAQVGVLRDVWEGERIQRTLRQLILRARTAGVSVIWVQHADDQALRSGTDAWQLAPGFVPGANEHVVHKRYHSAFAGTDLERHLKAEGVQRLILAGAATNWCIRATAFAAMERGFDLTVAADAHSTETLPLPQGGSVPAQSIVTEFNLVMEWMQFPGVQTEVVRARDIVLR